MSYVRAKKRKGKSGELTYYYLVEGERTKSKVKQKVIKYLGTSPYLKDFEIEPNTVNQFTQTLFDERPSSTVIKERLQDIGIPIQDGELKEISIVYNPPLRKFFIRIDRT